MHYRLLTRRGCSRLRRSLASQCTHYQCAHLHLLHHSRHTCKHTGILSESSHACVSTYVCAHTVKCTHIGTHTHTHSHTHIYTHMTHAIFSWPCRFSYRGGLSEEEKLMMKQAASEKAKVRNYSIPQLSSHGWSSPLPRVVQPTPVLHSSLSLPPLLPLPVVYCSPDSTE